MNAVARHAPLAWLRFALVGALFAGLNLLGLYVLVSELGMPYLWACVLLFIALNFLSYQLNKAFTFRLGLEVVPVELGRYYAVMALSLIINLSMMVGLVRGLGLHYLWASAIVTVVLAAVNYVAHAHVTFRLKHPQDAGTPLRVLQVSAFFAAHGGGIEAVANALARELSVQGCQMVWMAGGAADEYPGPQVGACRCVRATSVDFIEQRLGLPSPLWSLNSLRMLWREVRQADVVHIHDYLYMPTLCAALFAVLAQRPFIVTQHIGDIPFRSAAARRVLSLLNHSLGRLVLSQADQVVFISPTVKAYFERFARFSPPARFIPNGVDHRLYRATVEEPGEAFASQRPRLLFVGRFVEKKGLLLLRQCVPRLPQAHWVFVGWGPLSPLEWPVALAHVSVPGKLTPPEVATQYRQADLLVLPSVGEGFPLVVQEALACGTPVLVGSEVASAFPRSDDRCVFAVDLDGPDAVETLTQTLQRVLADPLPWAERRQAALALSRQWSWEVSARQYRAIYAALAERGEIPAPR